MFFTFKGNFFAYVLMSMFIFLNIESYSQCNPDNSSAPPFCAPEPSCPSGSFLWSQSINQNDGNSSLRMWCGATTSYTIPGPYPSNFGSGAITFNINDVISYDGYVGRNTVTQNNERWRLVFKKNGSTVGTTGYTGDVPDLQTQGYWRGSLGTVSVPNGVDQIIIEHWSVANDASCSNSPNSVIPTSVCISASPTAPDINLTCTDGKKVTLHASGTNLNCGGSTDINISIPNSAQVYQLVTEVVYKNHDPGNTVTISTTNPSRTVTLNKVNISGGSSNVYVYRGTITGTASNVLYNSVLNSCSSNNGLQSMVVYAYRNLNENIAQTGVFTNISGYCDLESYSVPVATDVTPRTLTIQVPISELTTDNRYLRVRATAGGVSGETIIYGPDPALNTCCVRIVTVTLNNVPGNTNSVNIEIDTRSSTNPGGGATGCGQSWVAAGITTVTAQCQVCTVTAGSIGANKEICYNTSAGTLTNTTPATGNGTISYQWQSSTTSCSSGWSNITGATNATYSPGNLTQTTYFRRRARNTTNGNTCDDFSNCVTVTVNPQLNLPIPDDEFCPGTTSYLKTVQATGGTPGYTYSWSAGLGSGSQKTLPISNATYTVTVVDANLCTAVDNFNVILNSPPNASASNDGPLTCTKTSVTLTANPATGVTYAWSGGGTSRTKTVTSAGTYTVTVTNNSNGCTAVATTTVTSDTSVPNVSTTNDGPLTCIKTSVTLTATGSNGVSYNWSGGGTTSTKTITIPGTYTVTVTASNGCTAASSTTVSQDVVVPSATADNIGGPLTCIDNEATIRAFPTGLTYLWNGPNAFTSSNRTNIISQPGQYNVTVTNPSNGCSATASTTVVQNVTPPAASASNNGPITCSRTSVTLTANPATGVTYLWSGGGQTTRTKSVTTGGVYSVTVTDVVNGCTAVATTTVAIDNTPPAATADNIGGPLTCTDNSVTIRVFPEGANYTYSWSGPSNYVSSLRTNDVSVSGTYNVTVTNITNGCTAIANTTVMQNTTPPNVTSDNVGGPLTCIDNSVTIRAFPDVATYSYAWSGPSGYYATSRTNNVSIAGNYTVTVTDTQNGCTAASSTVVLQDVSVPTASAGSGQTICNGISTTLTATGNGTYRWSYNNATTASITVTPTINTTYTVTVTGSNGCTNSASVEVNVTPLPASGLVGPAEICVDEYAVFTASPAISGATYAWTFGGGTSQDGDANDVSESIKWSNTYQNTVRTVTLTVTKDNCQSVYTKDILVKTGVYLNTQDNYPVCQGGSVQIGPNPADPNQVPAGANFTWTPNLFLNSNTVARPISTPPFDVTYTLTATLNGCAVSRQITVDVNVNLNPVADAGLDKTICSGESVQIGGSPTATPPSGATISGVIWSPLTGPAQYQTNPLVSPTTETLYRVVAVASTGCTDTDFVNITVEQRAKIGDYTWIDNNANGIQDAGDIPVSGVAVKLYRTSDNVLMDQTTTNNVGYYQFMVCKGTYYVEFGTVTGYTRTNANTPDDTKDSDANVTTGKTQNYTLNPGDNNPTVDAGYVPNGKIGDYVWEDTNGNGMQDAGEPGIPNVTVQLLDQNNNVISTITTNSQGYYEFPNLPPGTYYVHVTPPNGYNTTTPNSGNDASDSDISIGSNTTSSITLGPGEQNLTIDAGLLRPASLGDYVWDDKNANGVQDAGETPISGVTVMLEDASGNPAQDINGNPVASTTTNGSGLYQFTNLKPGVVYVVKFTAPAGYTPTTANTLDDTKDSDANPTTGKATGVTLNSGENNTTIDAGYYKPASLGDYVWDDTNGNGIQDAGEPGIGGLTVTLSGTKGDGTPVNLTTTTAADGSYSFTNLTPGTYTVTFTKPNGTVFTPKDGTTDTKDSDANTTTGATSSITLQSGENNTTVDAGIIRPASLGDYVWDDKNANGVQDAGETPISGVTVMLQDAAGNPALDINNNPVASTTTNASGLYQFTNLKPGVVYVVKFTAPNGYTATTANTPDDTKDSDASTTTGKATGVTLNSGENNTTIDAGYYKPASLGDFVWDDTNGNGIQDAGEPGIGGLTVTLSGTKGDGTPVNLSTTTAADGSYSFTNLTPGTYTVTFTKPNGTVFTPKDGTTDTKDSDANTTTGATSSITLQSGENNTTVDAGIIRSASLGDYVWDDKNANGVQDAGETPISGVTVMLQDAAGNPALDINNNPVASTTTNASGLYQFTNLKPGVVYVVKFTAPNGYTATTANTPDDTKDSDANPTTGIAAGVTLTGGENNTTIDAGYYKPASLGDYVWHDLNLNGIQDGGEPGIGNVTVRLMNSSGVQVSFTLTNSSGFYSFTNLEPGTYSVKFDTPASYLPTKRDATGDAADSDADTVTGMTAQVTLAGGENNPTLDAGYYKLASIGNFVWEDTNANGIQDSFEPGIANVTVQLSGTDALGNAVNLTTTTSNLGEYTFDGLVPGTYTVTFVKPGEAYKPTAAVAGSDQTKDSNANTLTGQSQPVTLTSGENNTTVDAGYYRCSTVGDYVWIDENRNGIQDLGEVGINGVKVELYAQANPTVLLQSMKTINDPKDETKSGYYNFEICTPGNYFLKVIKPDQYTFTQPNQGDNDNFDSDVIDFPNQNTLVFAVGYAVTITDIDAGIYATPLPIELSSFTGEWDRYRDVNALAWVTKSEVNNAYFEIERGVHGGDYEVVGKVDGAGNSSTDQYYSFDDSDIAFNGTYVYRLRQVDYDGRYSYSHPISIVIERKGDIKTEVYPNPSRGNVQIHVNGKAGLALEIDVYDNVGRKVIDNLYEGTMSSSDMIRSIDKGMLANGVYHIQIQVGGIQKTHKLIILE